MSPPGTEDILGQSAVEVEVDDYDRDGNGRVELDDGRLIVPRAMPGERIRVDVDRERDDRGRATGRLVEILEPADERRDPLCEKYVGCNGCHLRHLSIPEELEFKRLRIERAVAEHADLAPDRQPEIEVITPRPTRRGDAFRIRARLAYRRVDDAEAFELGVDSPYDDALVAMDDCPALTGSTRRLVGYIDGALEDAPELPPAHGESDRPGIRHLSVGTPTFGRGLIAIQTVGLDDAEQLDRLAADGPIAEFAELLADRLPEDVGLALRGADTRLSVKPPERITLPLHGLEIQAGYDDWFPTTLEPTEVLYETLLERILELRADDTYLDVGCGVGTLSLLVAPEVDSVTGIDINRHSIEAAELNAVRNGIDNVEFMPSGWEKALRGLVLEDRTFDVVTINPAREPLGERALAYLDQLRPRQVAYLGPSPGAAARDLGTLIDKDWSVEKLAAGNLRPATRKTLLVGDLRRADGSSKT